MEITERLIKEIVKQTVKELIRSKAMRDPDDMAYASISERLREHYKAGREDPELEKALQRIEQAYYFQILPKYYSGKKTINQLAEEYDVEVSTIKRNKKRLCIMLFELVTE